MLLVVEWACPIVYDACLGMAGNQVLEWADIDSEIKTANLKDVCELYSFPEMIVLTQNS